MKKFLLVLIGIVVGMAAIYFNIPRNIVASKSANINANGEGAFRYLRIDSNWQKWWPGKIENDDSTTLLIVDDYRFSLKNVLYNSFQFNIERGKNVLNGNLFVLPIDASTIQIQWQSNINSGIDPITKVNRYFLMKKLGKAFDKIVVRMDDHLNKTANIYGLDIKKEKVQTQHLISIKNSYPHFPGTADIYKMIGQVRDYIQKTGAKEEGQPMLNISTDDSIHFNTQVAIPVDKDLPGNNIFASKWMMKGGNILVAEVKGDMQAINWGFKKMEQYISDHNRTIIAIPFQMLVTDRRKEADSTKWLTRLYYPVM